MKRCYGNISKTLAMVAWLAIPLFGRADTTTVEQIVVEEWVRQTAGTETNYFLGPVSIGGTNIAADAELDIKDGELRLSSSARLIFSDEAIGEKNWSIHSGGDGEDLIFEEYESTDEAMRIQDDESGCFKFYFKGHDLTESKWVVIDNNGQLGVGDTTPNAKLDVAGAGRFDEGITYIKKLGDISMGSYTNGN